MSTTIYVGAHKLFKYRLISGYQPLQLGAALKDDLGYIKDSTGDNISCLNPSFCELTGLYWIWKNSKDDIVGLVHYRRYFYADRLSAAMNRVISVKRIENILSTYDIILPKKFHYKQNARESFSLEHYVKDFDIMREILSEKYPDYLQAFDTMATSRDLYLCNMFCAKKELSDQYCEWLFDILFEAQKRIDISEYDSYNKRLFGFLSERLFNVWIIKKELKIKECYSFNTETYPVYKQAITHPLKLYLLKLLGR